METFRRAHAHQGAAFVEIYQNCNVFNDGAFGEITAKDKRDEMLIPAALLREQLRDALNSRARAGHRHWSGRFPP